VENLIERLSLQSAAFQESFNMLSRSKNNKELAERFFQIVRGNLLILNAAFFFKQKNDDDWMLLFAQSKDSAAEALPVFNQITDFCIADIQHPEYKVCIHHALSDNSSIGILLGHKLDKSDYSAFDKIVLQLFLQQLDSAYQFIKARQKEKQLIFNLNNRVVQLNSLIDTGIEVARLQDEIPLLQLSLERVLALTNASKGLLRVKRGRQVLEKIFYPMPFASQKLERDAHHIKVDFQFDDRMYQFYLFEKESRQGRIPFDATDRLLLDAFARQVHASLENHFLHEQALEKERVEKEISLAGAIQKNLIPAELPLIEGYEQAGINIPTKYIGGDFYDCLPLDSGRYVFIMADVSGKGVAAGLLVSTLHAAVHAYVESPFELPTLVQKLNTVIHEAATIEKYITAFFAVLDTNTGELESVNAGHNPIYLMKKDNTINELTTGGIPLGMMGFAFPYESAKSNLEPGDHLLMYTDGVTEAMNEREEEYDDFRPIKLFLEKYAAQHPKTFISNLMIDLNNFTGNTPQSDDITAWYITRNA